MGGGARRLPGSLVAAALILAGCGSRHGPTGVPAAPASSASAVAPAPTLVTPPPVALAVSLSLDDLLDLARGGRIRSANIYDDGISGAMASDAGDARPFTAPRPRGTSAYNQLLRTLRSSGAAVAVISGPRPAATAG